MSLKTEHTSSNPVFNSSSKPSKCEQFAACFKAIFPCFFRQQDSVLGVELMTSSNRSDDLKPQTASSTESPEHGGPWMDLSGAVSEQSTVVLEPSSVHSFSRQQDNELGVELIPSSNRSDDLKPQTASSTEFPEHGGPWMDLSDAVSEQSTVVLEPSSVHSFFRQQDSVLGVELMTSSNRSDDLKPQTASSTESPEHGGPWMDLTDDVSEQATAVLEQQTASSVPKSQSLAVKQAKNYATCWKTFTKAMLQNTESCGSSGGDQEEGDNQLFKDLSGAVSEQSTAVSEQATASSVPTYKSRWVDFSKKRLLLEDKRTRVQHKLIDALRDFPLAEPYIEAIMKQIDFVMTASERTFDDPFKTKLVMTAHPSDGMIVFRETLKTLLDSKKTSSAIDVAIQTDLTNINKRQKPSIKDEWLFIRSLIIAHANGTPELDLNMAVWFDFDRSDKQEICYKHGSISESEDHLDDHYGNDLLGYLSEINKDLKRLGKAPIKAQLRLSAEHINANLLMLENAEIDTVIFANFTDDTRLQTGVVDETGGVDAMKRLMTENEERYTSDKLKEIASVLQLKIGDEHIPRDVFINKIGDHLQQIQGHDLLFAMQQILPQKVMALLEDPSAIAGAFGWCQKKGYIKQPETVDETGRTQPEKPVDEVSDSAIKRHAMMHACSDMGSAGFAGTLMSFVSAHRLLKGELLEGKLLEFKGTGNSALRHPSLPKTEMETLQGSKRYEQHFSRNLTTEEIASYWNYLGKVFLGKVGITKVSDLNQKQLEELMRQLNKAANQHVDSHNRFLDRAGDISNLKEYVPALGSRPVQTADSDEVQDRVDAEPEPEPELSADKLIKGQRAISRVLLAQLKALWPAWMMPIKTDEDRVPDSEELACFEQLMREINDDTLAGFAERLCAIPEHFVDILRADSEQASKAVVDLYDLTQQHRDIIEAEIEIRSITIDTPSKRQSTELLFLMNLAIGFFKNTDESFLISLSSKESDEEVLKALHVGNSAFSDLLDRALYPENKTFILKLLKTTDTDQRDKLMREVMVLATGVNAASLGSL